jgi:hypothetical protein
LADSPAWYHSDDISISMSKFKEGEIVPDGGHERLRPLANRSDFDLILEARRGWRPANLAEIYRYRDLLVHWTYRNLKARHAQSALGISWAII